MKQSILDLLLVETSAQTGISISRLKDRRQNRTSTDARKVGFLAGRLLGLKNEAIGWIFGKRDQSTVSVAVNLAIAQEKMAQATIIFNQVKIAIQLQDGLNASDLSFSYIKALPIGSFRKAVQPSNPLSDRLGLKAQIIKSRRPKLHVPVWDRDMTVAAKRAAVIARLG